MGGTGRDGIDSCVRGCLPGGGSRALGDGDDDGDDGRGRSSVVID